MIYIVATFDLKSANVELFDRYEAAVLPLLADHHGILLHRLRSLDHDREVHVIGFPSSGHFDQFNRDPRRLGHAALLEGSGVALTTGRYAPVGLISSGPGLPAPG